MVNSTQKWQEALSSLVTDPAELINLLELDPNLLEAAKAAARLFPLKVPRSFIARMKKGDVEDPLLRQVLPLGVEFTKAEGFSQDPLLEVNVNPIPGLLHKYHGRVLVTLTSACAIHCRYCFRRHFPYDANNPGRQGWERIVDYIAADHTISEVILSGGDPLATSDRLLQQFSDRLSGVSHVRRLRIHSRIPVVMPERLTGSLIEWLAGLRFDVSLVIHANHSQELDIHVATALRAVRDVRVQLFNQSVLLKGVNDNVDTLIQLSEDLFSMGVVPYYLHTLDKVNGASHFDIPLNSAIALYTEMGKRLPGYLMPKLVCEKPGVASKSMVAGYG